MIRRVLFLTLSLLIVASSAFGAKQTLLDGETLLSTRTKINAMFTEIYGWGDHAGLYSLTGHTHSYLLDAPSDGSQYARQNGQWSVVVGGTGEGGVSDHGVLTGLLDDDHTQYHTNARGDARYSLLAHTHDFVTSYNDLTDKPILGTMSTANSGTGIGQHPPLVDVGVCSDTQYTDQPTCTTGGGVWTAAAGWRIPGADFPAGGLTVDGVAVTPGTAAWDTLSGKPSEFQPVAHEHAQADITGLVARLDAMDAQIAALDANLSLAGFPSLTIDQTGTVAFTAATTTLTGTATDSGSITALEYQIDGGAWSNITPLTSPWSQDIAGASLTPNVASTVTVRATDDTALSRTRSVDVVYQTPVLAFSGGSGAFGPVDVNTTSAAQSYTLTNSGLATSAVLTTAKSGTDPTQFDVTVDTCNGNTLAPAGTCNINVTYSPDAAAAHTASLNVGGQSVALSGTGQQVAFSKYGYATQGSTAFTQDRIEATLMLSAVAETFTATRMFAYASSTTTASIRLGIYNYDAVNDSCGALLATTGDIAVSSTPQWVTGALSVSYALQAGTRYCVAGVGISATNGTFSLYYNDSTPNKGMAKSTGAPFDALDANYHPHTNNYSGRSFSCYASE